jgi:carbonic anhydrase
MGTLIRPPCREAVRRHVLQKQVGPSGARLAAFERVTATFARPVQPVHGRPLVSGA